jgi:hypothetical protein
VNVGASYGGKNLKLTVDKLCLLVTYKKTKEDAAIPSGKATCLTQWNETKHHLSPWCSPNNSKIKRRRRWRRRRGIALFLRRLEPLD